MPTLKNTKKAKPGPSGPSHPGNPPTSVGPQADAHMNQPIAGAGAGAFNFTAPDGAVEHFADPGSETNTPNFPFSATYSNENPLGGPSALMPRNIALCA